MQDLNVTLVQRELAWEDPADNRAGIEAALSGRGTPGDLVVLPEMFTTGFSMNALANAEPADGATREWMQALAQRHDCAITGSIAVAGPGGKVFNRMLFVTPSSDAHYDKRHLFRMAGEHKRYCEGRERVVVD